MRYRAVGSGLHLSCLGLSLEGILELEEKRESRWVEKWWNQDKLVCSRFKCLIIKFALIKREAHSQSHQVSWCRDVKLSEQPFSRNSQKSQFSANSGRSWRTGLASGRWQAVSHQRKLVESEKQHGRWPRLSGIWSEPACLGWRRLQWKQS